MKKLKILSVRIKHVVDESYPDGEHIGIIAKAQTWNPNTMVTQIIRSGGLWAIEASSPVQYLGEVALDQLDGLKTELMALGFGDRAIAYAFSKIEN